MFERASHVGFKRNRLPAVLITFHNSIAETQGKGRIWRLTEPALCEARFRDFGSVATYDRVNLVLIFPADIARILIDPSHRYDQRICTRLNSCFAAIVQLLF